MSLDAYPPSRSPNYFEPSRTEVMVGAVLHYENSLLLLGYGLANRLNRWRSKQYLLSQC